MQKEIQKLDQAVADFINLIHSLDPKDLQSSKTYEWGPKETLCHIVFWHEEYVRVLSRQLKGQNPNLLVGTFPGYNAQAVRKFINLPSADLVLRLQKAHQKLHLLASGEIPAKFRVAFKEGAKLRDFDNLLDRISAHFNSHIRQLKRKLKLTSTLIPLYH